MDMVTYTAQGFMLTSADDDDMMGRLTDFTGMDSPFGLANTNTIDAARDDDIAAAHNDSSDDLEDIDSNKGVFTDSAEVKIEDGKAAVPQENVKASSDGSAKKGKRPAASVAEKKRQHNDIERERRGNLNQRIQDLTDLLPGITVKPGRKPPKVQTVNKSIELISALQKVNDALVKENADLKLEVEAFRNGWSMQPPPMYAYPGAHQAQPGFAYAMPPAGLVQQQQSLQQMQQFQQQAQQLQQQHMAQLEPSLAPVPVAYPGMFAHVHSNSLASSNGRSDSISPASHISALPPSTAGSIAPSATSLVGSGSVQPFMGAGMYEPSPDITANPALPVSGSPSSYISPLHQHSPSSLGNNASPRANRDHSGSPTGTFQTAHSPVSTHNRDNSAIGFSPSSVLQGLGTSPANTSTSTPANAAVAAFDKFEPAFIAAHFGARDLAKSTEELQKFMAAQQQQMQQQQQLQQSNALQMNSLRNGNTGNFSMVAPQPQAQARPLGYGQTLFSPSQYSGFANVPQWQMSISHQAPLTTAYGGSNQF